MKRFSIYFVVLIAMLVSQAYAMVTTVNPTGLSDYKKNYFYSSPVTFKVKDYTPSQSDSFYLAISYDGATYNRIVDPVYYGTTRPSEFSFSIPIDTVLNNIIIGLFQNPSNQWNLTPSDIMEFNIVLPSIEVVFDTIQWSKGEYLYKINRNILNDQDTLDYLQALNELYLLEFSTDGTQYTYPKYQTIKDDYRFSAYPNKYFRFSTSNSKYTVFTSSEIEYKDSLHYINIPSVGGSLPYQSNIDLRWWKSGNYDVYKVLRINNLDTLYKEVKGESVSVAFNNYGKTKIIVSAENDHFRVTDSVEFVIEDPCISFKERISDLEIYIKDSTVVKLFMQDSTASVYEIMTKDIREVIGSNINIDAENITVFLYSSIGESVSSSYYNYIAEFSISSQPSGIYYLVIKKLNGYEVIKMLKV